MENRILLVAGYGGHAGYAYAVAHELAKAGYRDSIVLVAEGHDFLVEKFNGLGEVYSQTLPRKPGEPLYKGLMRWVKAFLQSLKLASKHNVKVVFAGGSNFSIPPATVFKALRGSNVYTLEAIEHFTKPSRAVMLLERLGAQVFLHWDEQLEMFPRGIVVGPVYEPPLYEPRDEGYVLVTTGTLGYKELFDTIEQLGLERVVLQTGDIDWKPRAKEGHLWVTFKYTSNMHKWIAGASLVITQQGMTAATASLAYRKPVIIVWNPRVVLGAPMKDTKIYADKINAVFLEEPDPVKLKKAMEHASKPSMNYPNGAGEIAKTILRDLSK